MLFYSEKISLWRNSSFQNWGWRPPRRISGKVRAPATRLCEMGLRWWGRVRVRQPPRAPSGPAFPILISHSSYRKHLHDPVLGWLLGANRLKREALDVLYGVYQELFLWPFPLNQTFPALGQRTLDAGIQDLVACLQ